MPTSSRKTAPSCARPRFVWEGEVFYRNICQRRCVWWSSCRTHARWTEYHWVVHASVSWTENCLPRQATCHQTQFDKRLAHRCIFGRGCKQICFRSWLTHQIDPEQRRFQRILCGQHQAFEPKCLRCESPRACARSWLCGASVWICLQTFDQDSDFLASICSNFGANLLGTQWARCWQISFGVFAVAEYWALFTTWDVGRCRNWESGANSVGWLAGLSIGAAACQPCRFSRPYQHFVQSYSASLFDNWLHGSNATIFAEACGPCFSWAWWEAADQRDWQAFGWDGCCMPVENGALGDTMWGYAEVGVPTFWNPTSLQYLQCEGCWQQSPFQSDQNWFAFTLAEGISWAGWWACCRWAGAIVVCCQANLHGRRFVICWCMEKGHWGHIPSPERSFVQSFAADPCAILGFRGINVRCGAILFTCSVTMRWSTTYHSHQWFHGGVDKNAIDKCRSSRQVLDSDVLKKLISHLMGPCLVPHLLIRRLKICCFFCRISFRNRHCDARQVLDLPASRLKDVIAHARELWSQFYGSVRASPTQGRWPHSAQKVAFLIGP